MKNFLLILSIILLFFSCSSTKLNSYNSKFVKQSTQAEFIHLSIEKDNSVDISGQFNTLFKSSITTEAINQIIKIPEYVGKIIKNSKKKYKQEYSAKNSITFKLAKKINDGSIEIKNLPVLNLTRKVYIKDTLKTALELKFKPVNLNNGFMLFQFDSENSKINLTKAKIKPSYPFVNLSVTIKGFYIDLKDNNITENEISSKEIIIPFKNGIDFSKLLNNNKIYSSPFKIQNLMAIEISVNETNPYYIKLNELETKSDENSEELTELIRRLLEKKEED